MRFHHATSCIALLALLGSTAFFACTGEGPNLTGGTSTDGGGEDGDRPGVDGGSDGAPGDDDGGQLADPPPAAENKTSWSFHLPTGGYLFTPVAAASDGYGVVAHNYLQDVPGLPSPGSRPGLAIVFFDKEGRALWKKGVVVSGTPFNITAAAFDEAGDIYLAGGTGGAADFGNDVLVPPPPSGSESQGFIVKLRRSDGLGVWSKVIPTVPGSSATLNSFTIRGATMVVAGTKNGEMKLATGAGETVIPAGDQIFLANLELATGKARWAQGYHVADRDNDYSGQVDAIALDANGNVYFGGGFRGTYQGFVTLKSSGPAINGYIASADAAGKLRWQRNFGSPSAQDPTAIGSLELGKNALIVGGQVAANADFGDGKPVGSNGLSDAYVAAYDPATGDHLWHVIAGGDDGGVDGERISSIAVDRWDQIVAVGDYRKAFKVGNDVLPTPPTKTEGDPARALFGFKLDASGKVVWSKTVLSPIYASARSVAATPSGSFIVGAALQGAGIDLGAGTIANVNSGFRWDLGVLGWTP